MGQDGWSVLSAASTGVAAIAAAVLCALMYFYLRATREIAQASVAAVEESKAQRQQGLRPVLSGRFVLLEGAPEDRGRVYPEKLPARGDSNVWFEVQNVGPGPALKTTLRVEVSESPDAGFGAAPATEWARELGMIGAGDGATSEGMDTTLLMRPAAAVTVDCNDVFGQRWRTTIPLTLTIEGGQRFARLGHADVALIPIPTQSRFIQTTEVQS